MNVLLMKEKNLYFPVYLIQVIKKYELELNDFLLLTYFWNNKEETLDVALIAKVIKISESDILLSFNNLLCKKLVKLDSLKDSNGKRIEIVNLDNLYMIIDELCNNEVKQKEKMDIYTIFENEFARPISSIEYEIIRAWIEKGFSEELILGALKEAVYNGVSNLRYIDKILYEWQRKGYKTMSEVNNHHNERREESEPKALFDYNWLDDNE